MTVKTTEMYLENNPYYTYTIPLEKVSYNITVRYSTRAKSWYMDIRTRDNVAVVLGVKLVLESPLLYEVPKGELTGFFLLLPKITNASVKYSENPSRLADYYNLIYFNNA